MSEAKRTFSVTLRPEVIRRLDDRAQSESEDSGYPVSRSAVVERYLREGLDRDEK